jgi:hypothetical protein|tara:strand:+ start:5567 stop:6523 length:957 start_codon:yes stop_codon:yes gene_type:complete
MSYFKDDPWEICEVGSYPDGVRFSEEDSRFWVSKDSSGSLILFVQEEDQFEVKDILKDIFSGLVLYQDTGVIGTRFVIKLEAKDLLNKFTVVCRSIVDETKNYKGANLYAFIYNELMGWSGFMRPKREGLSHEEYTGLWGELSVVVDYYLQIFGAKELMENWTGVKRTPQDLSIRAFTLEVKATFTVTPKVIHISSLEQLDAPVAKQALAHLRLSKSPDGRSMMDLISNVESLMRNYPTELARFHRTITELVEDASEEQMQQKNIILGTDCFAIRDDFPRLRRSRTDVAIDKAEYKILLHGLSAYEIEGGIGGFFENV